MLKVLILCKNISTAKSITNNIVSNIKELQLVGIANNQKEILELLEKCKPDLVISTSLEIIQVIKKNFSHYTPGIILIIRKEETPDNFYYKNVLNLNINLSFEKMCNRILDFIPHDGSHSKKEKATNLLSKLGFDFKLVGTSYLLDSILYANTYKGSYSLEQLKRDIYSYVAKTNSTTVDRVIWSIARSFNYMYKRHTKESYQIIEKYLGLPYPVKPTPKLVINYIANNLDI